MFHCFQVENFIACICLNLLFAAYPESIRCFETGFISKLIISAKCDVL